MNSKKNSRKKLKGVQKRKSGKYVSLIWDPFKKRCVWLGTFTNAEAASKIYISKKQEFEEKLNAKQGVSEKSTGQEITMEEKLQVDSPAGESSQNSGDQESEFGVLFGVKVIDNHGFLLGEFSKLDDLSICSIEDEIIHDHVFSSFNLMI